METSILSDIALILQFKKNGCNDAFNEILKRYDKLLKKLYHNFFNLLNLGITMDELEQEILISFYGAVQKYNPDRGTKFSTYCWQHINHDLCDLYSKQINQYTHIADNNIVVSDSDDGEATLDLLTSIPDTVSIEDKYQENLYYKEITDYISSLDSVTQDIYIYYLCNGLSQK